MGHYREHVVNKHFRMIEEIKVNLVYNASIDLLRKYDLLKIEELFMSSWNFVLQINFFLPLLHSILKTLSLQSHNSQNLVVDGSSLLMVLSRYKQ